jgi:hypothetical protein
MNMGMFYKLESVGESATEIIVWKIKDCEI